jgi:hypothetical protein
VRRLIPLVPLDLAQFSRTKSFKGNTPACELTAEASDFDGKFCIRDLFSDHRSPGIGIRSHRTGKTELFYLESEQSIGTGSDTEITGWSFVPVNPKIPVSKVQIFND